MEPTAYVLRADRGEGHSEQQLDPGGDQSRSIFARRAMNQRRLVLGARQECDGLPQLGCAFKSQVLVVGPEEGTEALDDVLSQQETQETPPLFVMMAGIMERDIDQTRCRGPAQPGLPPRTLTG